MAGASDDALVQVGPWPLGIANTTKEDRVPADPETGRRFALREADNIDLDAAGVPQRRRGTTPFHEGSLCHSLWSDEHFPFALFVDDGELQGIDDAGLPQPLGHPVSNLPLSYTLIGERVYFSNGQVAGLIGMDLQVHPWAPEQPAGQPTLAPAPGYSLHAGVYQVAVTFVDALGRESGSTLAAQIDLPDGHGIALATLPQPLGAASINVYLTDADDQVLRLHSNVAPGAGPVVLGTAALGVALATQFLAPMPPGQIVRLFNGRQLVASGRYLRWSPPLRYGLTNLSRMVMRFNAPIDLLEPAGGGGRSGGLYVAAGNRTYWLPGTEPESWEIGFKRSAGAVPGSACRAPGPALGMESAEDFPVWIGQDGQWCVGGPDGGVVTPKAGTAVVDGAERAATLFRAEGGLQQIVAAMRTPRRQGLQVTDRAVAHVIHEDAP